MATVGDESFRLRLLETAVMSTIKGAASRQMAAAITAAAIRTCAALCPGTDVDDDEVAARIGAIKPVISKLVDAAPCGRSPQDMRRMASQTQCCRACWIRRGTSIDGGNGCGA